MTTQILLGVDVGTTDSKVLATTRTGTEVCLVSGPTPWVSRPGGLAETDAEALADTVIGLLDRAAAAAADRLGAVDVVAIAVAGMAEVGVLVDAEGRAIHPAIAWFDPRGAAEMAATPEDFQREFPGRTGLPVSPLASIAKLLWLRRQGVNPVGRRWLSLPEFLVHRLGGVQAAELSLLSRTGLIDQRGPRLWPAALDLIGADESLVPPRVCAGTPLGRAAAERVPAPLAGAALTVAGHDHPVAAVGCGVTGTDELFDSFGTADALVRSAASVPSQEERARLAAAGINAVAHVLAGRTVLLGGTKGGLILRRTLEILGATDPQRRAELDAAATAASGSSNAGSGRTDDVIGGVLVSGAANNDGTLRITVDGDGFGPVALWRAALDHGAHEADRLLAGMAGFAGPVRRTVMAGGWIRMASVRAAKAAALPGVEFSQRQQAGAFGAAVFAGHAAAVADAMALAGDPGAVAVATPSGPTDAFVAAFVAEPDFRARLPASHGPDPTPAATSRVRTERGTDPAATTTDELEITA
jgi:sugar (pentulose or hexulose) kinase